MKKHELEIDVDDLQHLAIHRPRRKLWDLLPIFFKEWYLARGWHSPKPTPVEEWLIRSLYLRASYAKTRALLKAFAAQAEEVHSLEARMAPGSTELN